MGKFVDSVIAYKILKMLTTPFVETDAYRFGIIDAKGKELIKMKDLNTVKTRDSYTLLHRLVYRIKRIIERTPIENKKLVSYAAALALVKEGMKNDYTINNVEVEYENKLNENLEFEIEEVNTYLNEKKLFTFKQFSEDGAPANNTAATPIGNSPAGDEFLNTTIKPKNKFKMFRRPDVREINK
jgi:hypothetical protein